MRKQDAELGRLRGRIEVQEQRGTAAGTHGNGSHSPTFLPESGYTQGDILAANLSGLLTALGIGPDGYVLTVDVGEPLKLKWAAAGGHDPVTIGADAEHSLAGQVLSGVDAAAAQKGHVQLAGELGGTAASPTVAATHSGSAHHAQAHGPAQHTEGNAWKLTYQDGSGDEQEVALGADGQILKSTGAAAAPGFEDDLAAIEFVIDGGGSVIATGIKGDLEIPFDCTISRVTMLADQSGSIVVDIWKDTYANYPPTDADSITAAAPPTISAATKSQDSTLTDWTTAISAGDTLRYNVDSCSTITRVVISLKVSKT